MKYKESSTDNEKRRAAYGRNVAGAYDLLMWQYCRDIMKEQLETQPDYDTKIRDKSIAALQRIRFLAHNLSRSRYNYACIYGSLEQMLNIQQKDNKSIIMNTDTFEQNVEVLKTHLPMSIPMLSPKMLTSS